MLDSVKCLDNSRSNNKLEEKSERVGETGEVIDRLLIYANIDMQFSHSQRVICIQFERGEIILLLQKKTKRSEIPWIYYLAKCKQFLYFISFLFCPRIIIICFDNRFSILRFKNFASLAISVVKKLLEKLLSRQIIYKEKRSLGHFYFQLLHLILSLLLCLCCIIGKNYADRCSFNCAKFNSMSISTMQEIQRSSIE